MATLVEDLPEVPEVPVSKREELDIILVSALGSDKVYFQPPESLKLTYPCIVYKRDKMTAKYANNKKYANTTRYQVTVIDPNPDSQTVPAVNGLPLCSHLRNFIHDGLNHDIFELYY